MKLLLALLMSLPLIASVRITPADALKAHFGPTVEVTKKSLLLKTSQAKAVQHHAKAKLNSKIIRLYTAQHNGLQGYGILLNRKVRTKNAAILYIITPQGSLLGSEIVSFKEPYEYLPSQKWMTQFHDVNDTSTLRIGNGIRVITGATMSARTITEGARLALAIFHEAIQP